MAMSGGDAACLHLTCIFMQNLKYAAGFGTFVAVWRLLTAVP